MRGQRDGHIITISSIAGLVGWETSSAYAASKFALEGWTESLRAEVEPYGVHLTAVEPGYFRTELLEDSSTTWADLSVDYAERSAAAKATRTVHERPAARRPRQARPRPGHHRRAGPAAATVRRRRRRHPLAEAKAQELLAQAQASRELGMDLAHDDAT